MDTLADTLAVAKAEKLGDISRNVEAGTLVNTLDDNLKEALVQTPFDRLCDVEVVSLGDTLPSG